MRVRCGRIGPRVREQLGPAVPQPVVQPPRRHPGPHGQPLARLDGARAQLDLHRLAVAQLLTGVDALGERRRVAQHAVAAQDVRHEVVGEDRQPVDVGERRHARQHEVVDGDLGALEQPGSA